MRGRNVQPADRHGEGGNETDSHYFLYYAEATAVCILIFGILLINDRISMNRQEKQIVFDHALIAHILYFASDVLWAGVIAGRIPRTRFSVAFLNFSNFILLSAIAYEWFLFAAVSEHRPFPETERGRRVSRIPFAVMTVVMLAAYLIAPTFWASETGALNALYYPMMLAAPLFYVGASCVQSLRQARQTEDPGDRRLYRMIGLYPLAIVFFGVLQLAYVAAPLFCFGCTVMMLFFYIRSMDAQISLDPLTLLNNHGQLLRYVAQEQSHRREDGKTFVVIADADSFKQINDNYGHAEGDRALVLIAEVLKTCAKTMRQPPFLSRYGGDEFVLIVHAETAAEVELLTKEIHRGLAEACSLRRTPCRITVSVGYDEWKTDQSFLECLQHADAMLYEEKRRRKQRAQVSA